MYLYGASGHAKVIMDILKASAEPVEALVDDNPELDELNGVTVLHDKKDLSPMIVSIGVNATRKKVVEQLNCKFGIAVHPSAIISESASIEEGTVVMQGAIVQADVKIGKHCIINTGSSVDHECEVGDFVHISPHSTLCGNVQVGEGTWVGAGTTIIQGVKIGKWCVIGAGSVVTKDIPDGTLAVGNRCKNIKSLNISDLTGGVIESIAAIKKYIIKSDTIIGNILITSAGKRVSLLREFQASLKKYNIEAKVYSTELNPALSPAAIISDGCFKVPRVTDENYIEFLFGICLENKIGLLVPTIDTELLILSQNKDRFEKIGCHILVSSFDFVSTCRDKRKTGDYLESLGIRVPEQRDKLHPVFPMFAKPYDGSLSKDLFVIPDISHLTEEILSHPKLIFMEYIDKKVYKEFTVDMYYGKDFKVKGIVPRERLEIRAGEINKGITRKNFILDFLKEHLNYLPGVVGCICIQLFFDERKNDIVGIEINPRFGGGYPLSYAAGVNFPDNAIREYLLGDCLVYDDSWKDKTLMLRYDDDVIVYDAEI